MTGDIIIVPSTPPHIASVMDATTVVCEDGTKIPYPADAVVAITALDFVKSLESEVLKQNGAG